MSNLKSRHDWEKVEKKFIDAYPSLTEEDFDFEDKNELIIHLQQKIGKSEEELREMMRKV